MLKVRVISAVVLGLVALLLTWLGGPWFRLLVALGSAAVFYEWWGIVSPRAAPPLRAAFIALFAVLLALLLLGSGASTLWLALAVAVLLAALAAAAVRSAGWVPGGIAYAVAPAIALALLRDVGTAGLTAILYLFAIVWATDIFAYFAGRRFGGPKLAPAISPGKTWSGALGGTVGGIIAGLAVTLAAGSGRLVLFAVLALVLSVVSQVGDLFESFLKRRFGVKDSGRLVPGHGGFMDRVDGLIAAAIALYLAGALAGGAENPSAVLFGP
jgi:phosphatidate cytidylyltransferase